MGKVIGFLGFLATLGALAYVGLTAAFRLEVMSIAEVFKYLQPMTMVLLGVGALSLAGGLLGLIRVGLGAGFFAILAGVASLAAASGPLMMKSQAEKVPVIHDITTDTKYPPQFYAAREIRIAKGGLNSTEYNPQDGLKQLEAYPQIKPLKFEREYEEVFQAAKEVLGEMGLEIIATEENAGRIEATATTLWWGFKDDVVVKVNRFTTPVEVNIRSNSRVGKSDLGANAKRIEEIMQRLEEKLK